MTASGMPALTAAHQNGNAALEPTGLIQPSKQASQRPQLTKGFQPYLLVLQELQVQVEQKASSAKAERKKRENAERLCKQAVEDKVQLCA